MNSWFLPWANWYMFLQFLGLLIFKAGLAFQRTVFMGRSDRTFLMNHWALKVAETFQLLQGTHEYKNGHYYHETFPCLFSMTDSPVNGKMATGGWKLLLLSDFLIFYYSFSLIFSGIILQGYLPLFMNHLHLERLLYLHIKKLRLIQGSVTWPGLLFSSWAHSPSLL